MNVMKREGNKYTYINNNNSNNNNNYAHFLPLFIASFLCVGQYNVLDNNTEKDERRFLGCGAVYFLCEPTFLRNVGETSNLTTLKRLQKLFLQHLYTEEQLKHNRGSTCDIYIYIYNICKKKAT
jgi:hypothetical protein